MIIISPYSKALRNGKRNPKNYPYWKELISLLEGDVVQVGIDDEEQLVPDFRKNLSLPELKGLIRECDYWISCDSMFQHLGWDCGKKGIVLWGPSDPRIFGHTENINILKSRSVLRENQFLWWEDEEYNPDIFVEPEVVIDEIKRSFYS